MQVDPYHFPPEVLGLLKDVLPLLNRSKADLLDFFRGAGVSDATLADLRERLRREPKSVNKYEIARTVLTRVNEQGEPALRARREIIKRVVEVEDFSTCWPDDQLKARGLVAQVRSVVNTKDAFTRMHQERDQERSERLAAGRAKAAKVAQRRAAVQDLHRRLGRLFSAPNAQRRGIELEKLLNELFVLDGLLVRESFVLRTEQGSPIEQIDGVVELDHMLYLVEIKWWTEPLGVDPVTRHLSRVFFRTGVGGVLISASGFTAPAVEECKTALTKILIVLGDLQEIVLLLEREGDVAEWLRTKIQFAKIEKRPMVTV
jgi:multidrug efflux pump subunit AcrA (membrane-fusion protein)